jgi:type IV pilus assembly protein PilF
LANLGWVYLQMKKYGKARSYFEEALEIQPDFMVALHGIASIDLKTGHSKRVVTFLHRALERNPGAAILHADLAKAYEALHKFAKAKRSWKVVLSLVPVRSFLAKEAEKNLLKFE